MKLNLTLFKNELVPVYTTDKGNQVVNARELHDKLGIKEKFTEWIKRKVKDHQFVENQDYIIYSEKTDKLNSTTGKTEKRGRSTKHFIFLINPAKKIAMGTNNEQGDLVKDYFLRIEQFAKQVIAPAPGLMVHTMRETQIQNSKDVNSHLFRTSQDIPDYHRELTKQVCGKTPSQLKKEAKAAGMPSKFRTSGREVLRHTNPPAACTLSFIDNVVKAGADQNEARALAPQAQGLFAGMLKLGIVPAELHQ